MVILNQIIQHCRLSHLNFIKNPYHIKIDCMLTIYQEFSLLLYQMISKATVSLIFGLSFHCASHEVVHMLHQYRVLAPYEWLCLHRMTPKFF
jgi:hypothetical protein